MRSRVLRLTGITAAEWRLRSIAGVLVAAYAAVWLTPCAPVSVDFKPVLEAQVSQHGSHVDHDAVDHEAVDPSADHEGHAAHRSDSIEDEDTGFHLVAKCDCGCGSRPQAAASPTAPGYALFVQVTVPVPPPFEIELNHSHLAPILTPPGDSIEHVPIRFLS
jgi:hypothetical protein